MRQQNLPSIDMRYWTGMFIASLLGTTLGDFISNSLNLGFEKGLFPLAIMFVVVLFMEHRAAEPNEAYYWTAVVITRAAATNLADLATHQFKIEYYSVGAWLGALLLVDLLFGRWRKAAQLISPKYVLSGAGLRYWSAMAIASTLGTNCGDLVSDGLGLGLGRGSLVCLLVLIPVLFGQNFERFQNEAYYWITVLTVRISGTVMGDFLSSKQGLNFGFGGAAALTALLLLALVAVWPIKPPLAATSEPGPEPVKDF
jgi:uncharacterized membrane-anchored protein